MTTHVVMTSGGLASWFTGVLVARKMKAGDRLVLLFADVKGDSDSPHLGEDEDTYRFLEESTAWTLAQLPEGCTGEYVVVREGRNIWEVFHDERFLGNSRLASCSKILKQQPSRKWLDEHCDPEDTIVHVGIDWTEARRLPAIVKGYLPFRAEAPLTEPPYVEPEEIRAACLEAGMAIPRLYLAGFAHNNCGGFCVRAGQAQFAHLAEVYPERYAFHEQEEQNLRDYLEKDVTIIRRRERGKPVSVTLRRFREEAEAQPMLVDSLDWGGCGCFLPDEGDA